MRDKEKQAKEKLESVLNDWRANREEKRVKVDEEDILHVVSKWTGIPLQRMEQGETQRLLAVEAGNGQGRHRPARSRLRHLQGAAPFARGFEGPAPAHRHVRCCSARPASARRLLAKTLAEQMFGDSKSLIQLDMSEYMEKFNVSRLVGSPPGYVGYEEGGQLTEQVRRKPYSVVLFDEIEKAHPDVWNMLLQILEEGKLTDNVGRVVNFRNTIILMTSNVGSDTDQAAVHAGLFADHRREQLREDARKDPGRSQEDLPARVSEPAGRRHRVPLADQAGPHRDPGSGNQQGHGAAASTRTSSSTLDDKAKDFLVEKGYDPQYGARPMRRSVERFLEDPLAEEILKGNLHEGEPILVTAANDKLVFNQKAAATGAVAS